MSYKSLYRKYRPSFLEEVVGQKHIVEVLENSIQKGKVSHAYLFCGPRGTGKTSLAKIFARAVNCTDPEKTVCGVCDNCQAMSQNNHPDVVEIDAASNNGVDEIRGIIEKVKYTPILGKYKIYIIDEVHMLSQGAFNALLKTLEEPPSHVLFVLATTEVHKVLPTIISRCQRFDFARIGDEDIANLLDTILVKEGEKAEAGVTALIASLSDGGLRNALTILEQAIVLSNEIITLAQVYQTNGVITTQDKIGLFESFNQQDMTTMLSIIKRFNAQSVNFDRLMMDIVKGLKDSLIYTHLSNNHYVNQNDIEFTQYLDQSYSLNQRIQFIDKLLDYINKMRFSQTPGTYFEVSMVDLYSMHGEKEPVTPQERAKDILETRQKPITPVIVAPTAVEKTTPVSKFDANQISQAEQVENHDTSNAIETKTDKVLSSVHNEIKTEILKPNDSIAIDNTENLESLDDTALDSDVDEGAITPIDTEEQLVMPVAVDHELLLRLMVSANKQLRKGDEEKFNQIENYRNHPKWARSARLLNGGKLVLSSDFFVVIAMHNDIEVRELSEQRNRRDLNQFSEMLFGKEKTILPTSVPMFKTAVETFVQQNQAGTLPEKVTALDLVASVISDQDPKQNKQLERITDLFGDGVKIEE